MKKLSDKAHLSTNSCKKYRCQLMAVVMIVFVFGGSFAALLFWSSNSTPLLLFSSSTAGHGTSISRTLADARFNILGIGVGTTGGATIKAEHAISSEMTPAGGDSPRIISTYPRYWLDSPTNQGSDYGSNDDQDQAENDYGSNDDQDQADPQNRGTINDYEVSDNVEGPSPIDDFATIDENEIVTINVLANDKTLILDKPSSSFSSKISSLSSPTYGSVAMNYDGTITYTPFKMQLPADSILSDIIYYTASFDNGTSYYTGKITVFINQVNDTPLAFDSTYLMSKNSQLSLFLKGHDEDGDTLTYSIVDGPALGEFVVDQTTGKVVYTPYYNFVGEDIMSYTTTDAVSTSSLGHIRIIVEDKVEAQSQDGVEDNGSIDSTSGEDESYGEDPDDYTTDVSDDENNNSEPTNDGENNSDNGSTGADEGSDSNGSDSNNNSNNADSPPTVKIDILPGVYPNEINTNRDKVISVAILGSGSLNVSTNIDDGSLRFGPLLATSTYTDIKDVDGDGFADLVGYYNTDDLGLKSTVKEACQTGYLLINGDSISFDSCDSVRVVNKNSG